VSGRLRSFEEKLHWSLDVALREYDCRILRSDAAENFSKTRHIALNSYKSFKEGSQRKQNTQEEVKAT
jgi:predicted transposase YbfD/YdcC